MNAPYFHRFRSLSLAGLGALLLGLVALPARAERQEEFDQYVVHYNAANSTFFSAEVAKSYRIKRSKNQGVLVISVLNKEGAPEPKAVTAMLKGKVRNDLFQSYNLDFREIKEGPNDKAIYYVSAFSHGNNEKLSFSVDIQPDGQSASHTLSFDQTFFAN